MLTLNLKPAAIGLLPKHDRDGTVIGYEFQFVDQAMTVTVGPFPVAEMEKWRDMVNDPDGWIERNAARSKIALPGNGKH